MNRHIQPTSRQDEITAAILAMDLEPIKFKLTTPEGGSWTAEKAQEVAIWYRRFLMLTHLHRGTPIVPSKLVDDMWHTHILDTAKYADDCHRIFGGYVHHFPYFGVRSEQDRSELNAAWDRTVQMYREEFGEDPQFESGMALCSGGDDCGSGCAVCAPNRNLAAAAIAEKLLKMERPRLGDSFH